MCHIQVIVIFDELSPTSHFMQSRPPTPDGMDAGRHKLQVMDRVCLISMALCGVCYWLVGFFGYIDHPEDMKVSHTRSTGVTVLYQRLAWDGLSWVKYTFGAVNRRECFSHP